MNSPAKTALSLLGSLAMSSIASSAAPRIVVDAGAYDRTNTVVSFPLKTQPPVALRGADGHMLPLQVANGQATFVLPRLGHGESATFEIVDAPAGAPQVDATRAGTRVRFTVGGKSLLDYQAEPGPLPRPDIEPAFARGGYLTDVTTPSGRLVTDDFPANHLHHHGIWFPWTKTEFEGRHPDFWNMGAGSGRVEFVGLDGFYGGSVYGGLSARHRFVDLSAKPAKTALDEVWNVTVYAVTGAERLFDLVSTQRCASESPMALPRYHYGGLGVRGNWAWNGAGKTDFLTSEGVRGTAANETRGTWCYMGGPVDGAKAGIVVFCHPSNFRAPQPFRAHPSEPFLCLAPSQLGDWRIAPGEEYVSRYRFAAVDGEPNAAEFDRLYHDYAFPPAVKVEP